ncbi:MAG TPA: cytochrome b N-terminal domain-containing protein [Nitrospinota bacterium]|nr:cytochrome b N-terminal domain-containing protein [Nitrospinota bacterium]
MDKSALRLGYHFYLGVISFFMFIIVSLTGVLLMFYYIPATDRAYENMKDIIFIVPWGRVVRNMHRWAAHGMVLAVMFHMLRVFLTGSYKPPREFNWVVGIGLLVITLLLSFTGYLLPWDQLSFWAISVGGNMAKATPFIGASGPFSEMLGFDITNDISFVLTGGTVIGQNTLIRFYVLHCVVLPLIACGLIGLHFFRIRKDGGLSIPHKDLEERRKNESGKIKEASAAAIQPEPVKTYHLMALMNDKTPVVATEDKPYDEIFTWPHLVVRLVLCFLVVFTALFVISFIADGPLETVANPSVTPNPAKAAWYFLGLQELLVYFDPWLAGVVLPSLIISGLVLICYVDAHQDAQGGLHFSKRAFSVIFFLVGFIAWFALIIFGEFFRGPGWQLYFPWESWDIHKSPSGALHNLSSLAGWSLIIGYFVGGMVLPKLLWKSFYNRRGAVKYSLIMFHVLMFGMIFLKIILRLYFDVRYIITTPWFNI